MVIAHPCQIKVTIQISSCNALFSGICVFHLYTRIIIGLSSKYPAGLENEPELPDLMNEVAAEIPNRWRDVGIQLGVNHGVLEGIATISLGDTNQCYSNVFIRWKNQHLETHPYTWSTIVQALESRAVGEKRLASRIKNKLTGHPLQ